MHNPDASLGRSACVALAVSVTCNSAPGTPALTSGWQRLPGALDTKP
ncbi:MAG: hypothetical protein FJ096_22795 [Deltaproteobacteria bacterium]|nr:hypothetical protein [Deltaproteobacteria bacterium]